MSSLHVNKKKIEVASYFEVAAIFAIFTFILIILYPKDMLKEQILSESSNYDLTATYLENMLKIEPDNIELLLTMANVSLQTGKYDLSEKILGALKVIEDDTVQQTVYRLEYDLLETRKNSTQKQRYIDKYTKQMRSLLQQVALEKMFAKKDIPKWYHNAMSMSQKKEALVFIEPLYKDDNDLYWLEQCLYLASELKQKKEKKYCVDQLVNRDTQHNEKWLLTSYEVSTASGDTARSLTLISQLAALDTKYIDEQARMQLIIGNYRDSSKLYMKRYSEVTSKQKKAKYFIKALQSLQMGGLYKEVTKLAKQHEANYLKNTQVSNEIIKIYLASGNLNDAKRFSIDILNAKAKR
ncbi:MAG: tetratricopeptide repeat protein [Campylobacterota bacterium]|nr:tetratricopeptide repeat protein [Campylobacterota bacterium]